MISKLKEPSERNTVTVDVAFYDPFNVHSIVSEYTEKNRRLANLHWRPSDSFPLRPLPIIDLNWIEEIPRAPANISTQVRLSSTADSPPQNDQFYHDMLVQAYEKRNSYIKVMLVICRDVDDYRSRVRPLIREWLKQTIDSRIIKPSWFIVFYDNNEVRSTLERNPFNKMKSDFSAYATDGNTDAVFLRIRSKYTSKAEGQEFLTSLNYALKAKLLDSVTRRYALLSKMLNRVYQEQFPFSGNPRFPLSLKAAMGGILHDIGLYEDSLLCFEELRNMFSQLKNTDVLVLENGFDEGVMLKTPTFLYNEKLLNLDLDKSLVKHTLTQFEFFSFLFLKESQLLLALSTYESSLSLCAIHFGELMKRVKNFLLDIKHLSTSSLEKVRLNELGFMLIDEIVALPRTKQLISETLARINEGVILQNDRTSEILEFLAELKLQQRSELVGIGEYLGFRIKGRMMDISIDAGETPGSYTLTYEPLAEHLKSQTTFEKFFANITEVIIHDYALAGNRPRSVDILSTELAIIAYGDGDYQQAARIMEDSFVYYQQHGWKFVSGYLLKIYVECLQKVNEQSTGNPQNARLLKAYFDLLGANISSPTETSELIGNIMRLSGQLSEKTELSIDQLFDLSIKCFISSDRSDLYSIPIILKNQILSNDNQLEIGHVELILETGNEGQNKEIIFEKNDKTILKHGTTEMQLISSTLRTDSFKLKKLTATIGNVLLTKRFEDNALSDYLIKMYQVAPTDVTSSLTIRIGMPLHRELNNDKLLISLNNGSHAISKVKMQFQSSGATIFDLEDNANGYLDSDNSQSVKIGTTRDANDQVIYSVGQALEPLQKLDVLIPCFFSITKDGQSFQIEARVDFEDDAGNKYQSHVTERVKPSLTVAVSVQDIFKSSTLFSNFAIGTVDINKPLRIEKVELTSSEDDQSSFTISTGVSPTSVIAFGEQPASYFFKVVKSSRRALVSGEGLILKASYRDVTEECFKIAESVFRKAVGSNLKHLRKYEILLKPILEQLAYRVNLYSLSGVLQSQPINLNQFETDIFNHVPPADSQDLVKVMTEVTNQLSSESGVNCGDLCSDVLFEDINRSLTIAVPLRIIDVIECVEMKYERRPQYVVGEQISVTLYMQSITSWGRTEDDNKVPPSKTTKKSKKKVNFRASVPGQSSSFKLQFEIALLENWLISGVKSGEFDVSRNAEEIQIHDPIEIILFPLKVGRIPLPKIEISPIPGSDDISIEIDYKNDSEMVLVVSELNKVTLPF
ncbi:unnamed protein product [Kuraishia capsulata CBS 1993]|uniref:Trafficking protein particle complex subunit 11 domain-containing protein n=1 Tax=Kuraishia capsulata CBS 1993 TaxID=1382522 RepID=W6MLK1_9ASCO|nr:uncharacterized protein KUCA_T00003367001 [Kuraishia capsulata CBS 1993]CDK27389.1 unnamed protein product [Kuraishia capsulata CBS 1993]